ncbi:MAG: sulfite exporter TauE/SafE family protein [Clostridia bacterium]|nr:sulfite exporter TauE/SafE family protein [Clostridia bacterium]
MEIILGSAVSLIAGFLGAIGVGGGSVLILYLTLFLTMPQLQAQGTNLLFFIPCSAVGLFFHIKHKLVDFRQAFPLILFGTGGVILGFFLNRHLDETLLRKLFGAFVILIAITQIHSLLKNKNPLKTEN